MIGVAIIAGAYLEDQLSSRRHVGFSGNAGAPLTAASLGGTAFIAASAYLPGTGMSKGTITVNGEAKVLPGFQRMELVQVDGCAFHERAALKVDTANADCWLRWGHLDKSGWKYERTT
jgi:formylmethanofuran dehydrogenase subunit C